MRLQGAELGTAHLGSVSFNDCDKRFGDEWPGRIPAQLIAHILYYFSERNDLVFDPMGGGGVTPDTCLAFNRRCRTLDMIDRPDSRPEIEYQNFHNTCLYQCRLAGFSE